MWTVLFYIVIGIAAFWYWMFIGSRWHCPNCGRDLSYQPLNPLHSTRRHRSCSCGWHEDDDVV